MSSLRFSNSLLGLILYVSLLSDAWALSVTINSKEIKQNPVVYLPQSWKTHDSVMETVTSEFYNKLPIARVDQSMTIYVPLRQGPPEQSWVLRIDSDVRQRLAFYTTGTGASGQILLQNSSGVHLVWESEGYLDKTISARRVQVKNLLVPLVLEQGENFLILNSKFLNLGKNKDYTNTGFELYSAIGNESYLESKVSRDGFMAMFPLGILACLAIYSLLIYFSRDRKDKDSLYIFLINAAVTMKEFASQGVLLHLSPSNTFIQVFSSGAFVFPVIAVVFMFYAIELHIKHRALPWLRKFCSVIAGLSLILAVAPYIFPFVGFGVQSIVSINVLLSLTLLYFGLLPITLIEAIKAKQYQTTFLAIGIIFLSVGNAVDFANVIMKLHWPWFALWGSVVFSLILAKNNSITFAKTYARSEKLNLDLAEKNREVQSLNQNLEIMVEERTAEVRLLLTHIPQGILSIGEGGLVSGNYSDQLPSILGTDDIAGKSFLSLLLQKSDLTQDSRDQAWQSILAIVGEYDFSFECNGDKLPSDFAIHRDDKTIRVRLTWNIKSDSNGYVSHLLVTVLDVTAEWEAKSELEKKNQKFELIGRLIEIGAKKSAQFISSAKSMIVENVKLLTTGDTSEATVKILFINAHTMKGGARSLRLNDLAELLHDVETKYGEILQNLASYETEALVADCQKVDEYLERLIDINSNVLGRSIDLSKVIIDREFLEQCFTVFRSLKNNDQLSTDIQRIIATNSESLLSIIFSPLESLLSEVCEQVPKITKDLGKIAPQVNIDCPKVLISSKQDTILRNCMVHLLRNSLDHGIEAKTERLNKGKHPEGLIEIVVRQENKRIGIIIRDDGRGLALKKLKDMGIKAGVITHEADQSEIANVIFHQGLSTANKVSQISGRGVGMDAVRNFINEANGDIAIVLDEQPTHETDYLSFHYEIWIPLATNIPEVETPAAA